MKNMDGNIASLPKQELVMVDMMYTLLFPWQTSFFAFLEKVVLFQILNSKKTSEEKKKTGKEYYNSPIRMKV
jgi:hypothetical protein